MPAVPRLLNRVYDKVNNEISNSPLKKFLFRMALNSKESEIRRGIIRRNSLWDKLIFRKIQEGFGGQLRLMVREIIWDECVEVWIYVFFQVIGSAPLMGQVLTFTRCALGCLVVEGYGQTECVAAVTLTVEYWNNNFLIFKTQIKFVLGSRWLCSRTCWSTCRLLLH